MRFLAPALLFLPLMSFATPPFQSLKSFDGRSQFCKSAEDIGKGGVFLRDTEVEEPAQNAETREFSFGPQFYRCSQGADGLKWTPSSVTQFLSQEVKTEQGVVKIIPTDYQWVVYSENYTVLNPQPNLKSAKGHPRYSVRIEDLLPADQKERRAKGLASRGIVTVFLKYSTKAVYPDGKVMELGSKASGSFHIIINMPTR